MAIEVRALCGIRKQNRHSFFETGISWMFPAQRRFQSTIATSVSEPASNSTIVGCSYALPLPLQVFLKAETNRKFLNPRSQLDVKIHHDFGMFDAVVSVGAFEHFCSLEEYREGKQEVTYRNFFKTVADLLPPGGRLYLQTMAFGKNMISDKAIDINAPRDSDQYLIALMAKHFPGSWLPYGSEMIIRNAEPFFKMINISSGRLDYIETTNQWRKRIRRFNLKKYLLFLKLLPQFLFNQEFRHKLAVFRTSANKKCFERQLIDHFRVVLEKK